MTKTFQPWWSIQPSQPTTCSISPECELTPQDCVQAAQAGPAMPPKTPAGQEPPACCVFRDMSQAHGWGSSHAPTGPADIEPPGSAGSFSTDLHAEDHFAMGAIESAGNFRNYNSKRCG